MSSTVLCWILRRVKNEVVCLRGQHRLYSRCLSPNHSSSKVKRKRMKLLSSPSQTGLSRTDNSVFSMRKVFRHSSTEEELQFQLTPVQINRILRANEQSVKIPEFDGKNLNPVLKFESNQLPANSPNEDRRSAATCLQTKGMLFGVFDGHAGYACAQAVSERLFYYITVALMSQKNLEEIEFAMEHMKPVLPILQWYKPINDYIYRKPASLYLDHLRVFWQELIDHDNAEGMSTGDSLAYAFKRLDSDISLEAQVPLDNDIMRNMAIQVAFAGSTACVAHVDNIDLHVANSGDCRAILGVLEEDGCWSSLPLTHDHNALNPSELARVRSEHPKSEENTVVTGDRLLGLLMPLRAFGDVCFKWSKELQQSILESGFDLETLDIYHYAPPNYLSPPYLNVDPELTYHKLRPQDKFLILATDGLWDMLSNDEAVRLVAEHLTGIHLEEPVAASERQVKLGQMHSLLLKCRARAVPSHDPNVATHLIRNSIGTNEYGEIEQVQLSAMMSLPEDLTRMYRDDITVTVVYFNSDLIKAHYKENNLRFL
ncbi:[Pyruvate dehydrogenase [acetyl-transferring]]-phosphatase 2, mitochondrial [Acipenser ruthenus]|uniref:[Pyruvate dehydrogenase [acetyl-transferring]]-phosphatase 2, mitochondrial n=1 Tax=Acipenser ruthenus TaxID=7906 RepID=A0A444U4F1_ACIRT|nr:[Pyruvate dehydrogenase [acetyl-transferring]]-phosphatase 2, mitochondrial [Acipenser ruthenus]